MTKEMTGSQAEAPNQHEGKEEKQLKSTASERGRKGLAKKEIDNKASKRMFIIEAILALKPQAGPAGSGPMLVNACEGL
jgi:hypothetical protein